MIRISPEVLEKTILHLLDNVLRQLCPDLRQELPGQTLLEVNVRSFNGLVDQVLDILLRCHLHLNLVAEVHEPVMEQSCGPLVCQELDNVRNVSISPTNIQMVQEGFAQTHQTPKRF